MTDVHAWADQLRQYATHFEISDWNYTRNLDGMKHIRYERDTAGSNRIDRRWRRGIRRLLGPNDELARMLGVTGWKDRWYGFLCAIRKGQNVPDGVLDGGGIITYWEEVGEYLQYVQPSVGALLADLMDAHPDLPEVQAIAAEMKRINDDYAARIEAGGGIA